MKSVLAVTVALVSTLVAAQSGISDLPSCANQCALSAFSGSTSKRDTTCSQTDFKCICSQESFIESIGSCVEKSCDEADVQKTLKIATDLCSSVGVTLPSDVIASVTAGATSAAPSSTGSANGTSNSSSPTTSATPTQSADSAASALTASSLTLAAALTAFFLL